MAKAKDAWKQVSDLYSKYTKRWHVRPDLRVTAKAADRCVEFSLGKYQRSPMFGHMTWDFSADRTTTRNVGTMRELAYVLLAACDFVEESNPSWADNPSAKKVIDPEMFEGNWDPKKWRKMLALPIQKED